MKILSNECPVCKEKSVTVYLRGEIYNQTVGDYTPPDGAPWFLECTNCWMYVEGTIPDGHDYYIDKAGSYLIVIGVFLAWAGEVSIPQETRRNLISEANRLYFHPSADVRGVFREIGYAKDDRQNFQWALLADALDDSGTSDEFPKTMFLLNEKRRRLVSNQ